jgi:hypothetical protein
MTRPLTAQKSDRAGDVLRRRYRANRNGRCYLFPLLEITQGFFGHLGLDPTRSHCINIDAPRGQFTCQRFCESN